MSPEIIMMIVSYGLRYGPDAARVVKNLFTRPAATPPTDAEWESFFITLRPYEAYVAEAKREAAMRAMLANPLAPNP